MISDLNKLVSWSQERQVLFSTDKCKVMHMGYNNSCVTFKTNGKVVEYIKERYLGVIIAVLL